jgi:hypothetical protein
MADNEFKAEPVSPSALIKVGGTNFASMTDASAIDTMRASAPAFHSNVDHALRASGKVRDEGFETKQTFVTRQHGKTAKMFKTGAPVIHVETGKKLTIIHASVGFTRKSRTPVHKCADKNGNVWDIKESKLKLRM